MDDTSNWESRARKGSHVCSIARHLTSGTLLVVIILWILLHTACGKKEDAGDALAHLEAGRAAFEAGDAELALEEFQKAIRLDGALSDAYFRMGNVYTSQDRLSEAEEAYRKSLELNPDDPDALSNLGVIYYRSNRLDEAAHQFREALRVSPNDADILYNLGGVYFQKNQLEDALEQFEMAKEINPDLPQLYLGFGLTYKALGQNADAQAALEKFLELSDDPLWRAQAEMVLQEIRGAK